MSFQSIWNATAPAGPALPFLTGSHKADVVVIGAGFQGLSTALHLAEKGTDVVVLEAQTPGAGASGRNGGQVIPGLKDDPDWLDRHWGPQATAFAGSTADTLFDLIDRLGLECEADRSGWIQAGNKAVHMKKLEHRMAQWQARGASVSWLDAAAMAQATGTLAFKGGWIDRRAGKVHPLKLVQGLTAATKNAGAKIFGHSAVVGLDRSAGSWTVRVAGGGTVACDQVVLASNMYTASELRKEVARATVSVHSFQVATQPLDPDRLARILPGGVVVSEVRRVGTYFRIGPQARLMIGGRGSFSDPRHPSDFGRIEKELTALFGPGLEVAYRWFGRVGITPDHRIRLCKPEPGLILATGFNGRGVALSVALGKAIADHLAHDLPMPVPMINAVPTLPFHRLHAVAGTIGVNWYRLRDYLDR
ncbi:FAD-dependent oxidoreductase [Boseongicola sp. H5]|uniref:NAD(P)/FAD-dependent oxidoreductase n=1 Tax=Boseongicola sp. H5 TaxID=2763261 RepID=UPI001D0B4251|nr:FAD-dependent oxidoreductase [Boseongicola sp. H5]